jgi:hypothetical protein
MKQILILFFVFSFIKVRAQENFPNKKYGSLLSSAVDNLNQADFYFVGQAHGNQANIIIEKGLLLSLSNKFNVRNYILEYGQSLAFLLNQYLETGQDSILSFINSKGNFDLVKTIKSFNDTVSDLRKIKFFGVDFENRLDGKWTKKAIEIISDKIKLADNHPLQILLNSVINQEPKSEKQNLDALKTYLKNNEQNCRTLLGKYYVDVLLISNSEFAFSPKRDKAMFANFKLLYNELTRTEANPKFFASFGFGHVNPDNKNGLPYRLLEDGDSPIKGKVSIIGAQYYNCRFKVREPTIGPSGTLSSLCKNSEVKNIDSSNDTKAKTITYFSKNELNNFTCKSALNKLDGIIIIRNFDANSLWAF